MKLLSALAKLPSRIFLSGGSALQLYNRQTLSEPVLLLLEGDLADAARCFDPVSYLRSSSFDAIAHLENHSLYIRCCEQLPPADEDAFHFDVQRQCFIDRSGIYPQLRKKLLPGKVSDINKWFHAIFSIAHIPFSAPPQLLESIRNFPSSQTFDVDSQRILLRLILSGAYADTALSLLSDAGWIDALWPEIAAMQHTAQGKSEHPEGNVWDHSLEALKYRKIYDLRLSMAVLLHDIGKPESESTPQHRFHLHADIGAKISSRLLRSLGFPESFVQDTSWLIKYHSIPGALERLPAHRSNPIMENPLFPLLLELYRCDLSATFRGPENYYRACAVYRKFLKLNKNPFRDTSGKKLLNLLVE